MVDHDDGRRPNSDGFHEDFYRMNQDGVCDTDRDHAALD